MCQVNKTEASRGQRVEAKAEAEVKILASRALTSLGKS